MKMRLPKLFGAKSSPAPDEKLEILKQFSIDAPLALDPEALFFALALLEKSGWKGKEAARLFNKRQMEAIDDAYLHEPFG